MTYLNGLYKADPMGKIVVSKNLRHVLPNMWPETKLNKQS